MHLRRKYGLGMAPSPLLSLTAARSGGGGGEAFVPVPIALTQGTSGVFWTGTPPLRLYEGEIGVAWEYPLVDPGTPGGGQGGSGTDPGGGSTVPSVNPLVISASPEAGFDTLIVYTLEDA